MPDRAIEGRQSTRFLLLYALAVAGGAIAYIPFLTILLPLRVSDLAGEQDISWLAYITFTGAVIATVSNILFGWLSDRVHNRRIWIWGGLILSSVILIMFTRADTLLVLLAFIVVWQTALNMLLSPLAAWAGDCVPDHQKGRLGGLLAFAPALGAVAGAIVTVPELAVADTRLWIVAAMMLACVLPVLLFGNPVRFAHLEANAQPDAQQISDQSPIDVKQRSILVRMWVSRLLVQICEAALFAYVLFWFRAVDSDLGDDDTAQIISVVIIAAVPMAMLIGRWADKNRRPIRPLSLCAMVSAIGLMAMAFSQSPVIAIASYAIFGMAASVFLSLHTSQTLRVLPKPEHRGRDLGIFNLTNTTPSLIMPWLVVMLVPAFGFQALLAILSLLALLASLLLRNIDSQL